MVATVREVIWGVLWAIGVLVVLTALIDEMYRSL